jgi:protein-L-isoaspartate(D-aspartate) O-methyltransferase
MTDYAEARAKMIDSQLRTEDVTDYGILAAMGAVPRELFVPAGLQPLAYIDEDLLLKPGTAGTPPRYLMEPAPLARLIQAAEISPSETVLDIGCGTGYATAVLSRLAASVVALDSDGELTAAAERNTETLSLGNVEVLHGKLEDGFPRDAPYDVIFIEGAVEMIPDTLFAQLGEGGRLLAVVGYGRAASAIVHTKTDGDIGARPVFDAHVPPLPGFSKPKTFVF